MKASKSIQLGTFLIYASALIGLWQGIQDYHQAEEKWVLDVGKDSIQDDGLLGSTLDLEHVGEEIPQDIEVQV